MSRDRQRNGGLIAAVATVAAALMAATCDTWAEDPASPVKQEAAEQLKDAGNRTREATEDLKQRAEESLRELRADARRAGEELRDSSVGQELRADLKDLGPSARQALADTALTARIKTALLLDKDVMSFRVSVETFKGRVTLTGQLPDEAQVDRATDIARRTEGVSAVDNRLSVG